MQCNCHHDASVHAVDVEISQCRNHKRSIFGHFGPFGAFAEMMLVI